MEVGFHLSIQLPPASDDDETVSKETVFWISLTALFREEHEDALLHEVLLCLKALCTTKRALRELDGIQTTLFPQLVRMIFDEEHKGPSEFNTRGIVFSLLCGSILGPFLARCKN